MYIDKWGAGSWLNELNEEAKRGNFILGNDKKSY